MKGLFCILIIISIRSFSQGDSLAIAKLGILGYSRILIVNCFDAKTLHVRKNKEELCRELADSLKNYLAHKIKDDNRFDPVIIPGTIEYNDSLIFSLMHQHNAAKTIVIRSVGVYFDDTKQTETENSEGKPQTTTDYDLCSNNRYALYDTTRQINTSEIDYCKYFTSRTVKDGRITLSVGPDIVAKKKHTYSIVDKNAGKYLAQIEKELNQ